MSHLAASAANGTTRPSCWLWARNLPLTRLAPELAPHLPDRGAELLELLSQHERRWAYIDYPTLVERTGMSAKGLQRRLRALRELGLVETMVRRRRRDVVDLVAWGSGGEPVGYGSQVWMRPAASSVKRADGTFAVYVTKETLVAISGCNTRGGKRPGAGRKAKSNRPLVEGSSAENQVGAGNQTVRLLDLSSSSSLKNRTSPEGGAPDGAAPSAPVSFSEGDGFDPDALDLELLGDRRPIPAELRGPMPDIPALDRPATTYPELGLRVPDLTPADKADPARLAAARAHRVDILVRCYDLALRSTYGKGFGTRDVTRLKTYPALLKAAEAFNDHDIPPAAWAEWRLAEAKKRGEEPWPLGRVMQAASVVRLRGFFKKQTGHALEGKQEWLPYHDEQRHRAREAMLIWTWGPNPPLTSLPKAYTAMREKERALGGAYVDPLHAWPRSGR